MLLRGIFRILSNVMLITRNTLKNKVAFCYEISTTNYRYRFRKKNLRRTLMTDPIFSTLLIFITVIVVGCVSVFVYDNVQRIFTVLITRKPAVWTRSRRRLGKVTLFPPLVVRTYATRRPIPVVSYARSNHLNPRAGNN